MSYFMHSSVHRADLQSAQNLIREHCQRMFYYSSINFYKGLCRLKSVLECVLSHYEVRSIQTQEHGRKLENSACKPELRSRKQFPKSRMEGNCFHRSCSQMKVKKEAEKEGKMKENYNRLSLAEKR